MDYIKKHLIVARELLYSSSLSGTLSRNALGSLALRIGALFLAFALNVVLARFLGVDEYGAYVYAIGWLNILLIPATLGFDKLLVRQIAIYQSREQWDNINSVYQFAVPRSILMSVVVSLLFVGLVYLTNRAQPGVSLFYSAVILVPILALIRLQQAALQGLNLTALGQFPELIVQPFVLLILIFAVFFVVTSFLRASQVMILNVAAGIVALSAGSLLIRRFFPLAPFRERTALHSDSWMPSLITLMSVSGVYMLNEQVATILLGFLDDARHVAIFAAAERWARFVVFMLYSLNPVVGPIFARLYANNEKEQLQRVITRSAQIVAIFALVPLLAFVVTPALFLSVFGSDFEAGRIPLIILAIGQFINALTGSVGVLLSMVGYERTVVIGAGVGVLVNLLLGSVLIPHLHATGAAIGSSASTLATSLFLSIFILRTLKIVPTALGSLFPQRNVASSRGKPTA